jgi:adenylate cyclase
VARELGLGALQVWQALSEASGRGRGSEEITIVFTDLVDFSSWALGAGDDAVLSLLRDVAGTVEPAIEQRGGHIVKRLGDGLMAVFEDPAEGVAAAGEACVRVGELELDGHRPALRAGVHLGRPRRLGGDYLGVDVNVAARVTEAAGGGEVLVSDAVRKRLEPSAFTFRRKRRFRAKGAPKDLAVYAAERA